jgi:hypothetical protein
VARGLSAPDPRPSARGDRGRALLIGSLGALVYLLTAPDVVNLDGLGYLKLLPHNFAAGHLAYMPLLRALCRVTGLDGLHAGRLLSALAGGSGLVLFYGIVRRVLEEQDKVDGRFAATFAALGLGLSYGYWVEGADVEAYAVALVAVLATVRLLLTYGARPTALSALAVGAALGAAVLTHLTNVALCPFVVTYLVTRGGPRRRAAAHAALALGVGGALTLASYGYAALIVRGHDLHGALQWVLTAGHGFRYGGGVYRVADALYGLCKALVYAPYLYEADAPHLIGQFLLGLALLVALVARVTVGRARARLDLRVLLSWGAPYAALGVAFFGSDCERWLFVLPALWLVAAAEVASLARRRAVALALTAYLGLLNFSTGIWPAHVDGGVRRRAQAAAASLHDGDLVVFPGHSWDEYVGSYAHGEVEPFPIAYYAARDGLPACFARLDREIAAARRRGGRVFAARVFDDDLDDPRGFAELRLLGLDRATLRARLTERLRPRPAGAPPGDDDDHAPPFAGAAARLVLLDPVDVP